MCLLKEVICIFEEENEGKCSENQAPINNILPEQVEVPCLHNNQILFPEIDLVLRRVPQCLNPSQI